MKILRTASLESKFTGSYQTRVQRIAKKIVDTGHLKIFVNGVK